MPATAAVMLMLRFTSESIIVSIQQDEEQALGKARRRRKSALYPHVLGWWSTRRRRDVLADFWPGFQTHFWFTDRVLRFPRFWRIFDSWKEFFFFTDDLVLF